jgi:DNA-binding SARP family transcriptional activator
VIDSGLEFRILGPLEVRRDGERLALGGVRTRSLLAVLLLEANRPLSTERLIDRLWGERSPPTARAALQGYVAQLRRVLGEGSDRLLVTERGGYRLAVEPERFDLARFEQLVELAREATTAGEVIVASERYAEALALWRGPALADLTLKSVATAEAARLEELRLIALEGRVQADLAMGRSAALVEELRELVPFSAVG